jgi:hypothetical protein
MARVCSRVRQYLDEWGVIMDPEAKADQQMPVGALKPAGELTLDEGGALVPKTAAEAVQIASYYLKSKMLPARFNTVEMIVTAWQYALELGLKPLTALRQIAVVQGTPCTFGDLPLALVQRTGKLASIREYLVDKNSKEICVKNMNLSAEPYAAVCVVRRRCDEETLERFFSMDDAKRAGLGNSPTWKAYTPIMLKYRARSQALKDKFPDCLNGIAIAEYDFHILPNEESPRLGDAAADLNAQFIDVETPSDEDRDV